MKYPFALNNMKLQRAIASAKGDESKVYDEYVKIGGKVSKDYADEHAQTETMIALTESNDKEIGYDSENVDSEIGNVESAEPKKRGRPRKNVQ